MVLSGMVNKLPPSEVAVAAWSAQLFALVTRQTKTSGEGVGGVGVGGVGVGGVGVGGEGLEVPPPHVQHAWLAVLPSVPAQSLPSLHPLFTYH